VDIQAPDEETMVKVAVADLDDRFESIDRSKIETTVRRLVHELFMRSRIKSFVGILAERRARAELRRIAVEPTHQDGALGIEHGERRV
jgi:hypothetical protein